MGSMESRFIVSFPLVDGRKENFTRWDDARAETSCLGKKN